jgi:hypothetical protein
MTIHARFFRVWSHRYSGSIFGAGSSPVIRNGSFLCFESEERAQAECDRLNAQRNDMQVRYSVEPDHIEAVLPPDAAKRSLAEAPFVLAAIAPPHGVDHHARRARVGEEWHKMDAA